jgi:hypothetical protein
LKIALEVRNIVAGYFALSELVVVRFLALAVVFRAFGAVQRDPISVGASEAGFEGS